MSQHWRTPPRRTEGPFEPPARSRGQVAVDRLVAAIILAVWVGLVIAIASCVSAA